ncbi:ABC transporter permease [Pseudemcibacter aquimaris]|uniref:ABC transporter permease n=1 Tax=Pseudemcibacter aquimaris TaxID=2857064 RepID=UPI002010CE02|nr:ABC transporter permease [Pseudemcibacter aquimaris]MCC3860599.1 ABC transporter permease [Pseudemcibacter aquimaris]WDU59420.1 FtsX-like permease family protein [Pseudemcibacter aquimaris]
MFKNYFKTAVQNILNNKLYSLINIGGLAIGLAAVMLISLFVIDELSYDKWIPESENIFRLESTITLPGQKAENYAGTPGKWYESLQTYFSSELEAITRVYRRGYDFRFGESVSRETVAFVDYDFFDVFDLPIIAGDPSQVFQDNASIIINEEKAAKYFPDKNPIGETMILGGGKSYKIVAMFKNLPENTHLDFEMITWFDTAQFINEPYIAESWVSHNVYQYLKLNTAEQATQVENKFPNFLDTQLDISKLNMGTITASDVIDIKLMPLEDIHLHSQAQMQFKPTGDINVVYNFSSIALLVLAIACINFMNLSTSRSFTRAKEVAVRKVCGASKKQVASQFLMEAILITIIASLIAFILVELALPIFSDVIEKVLSLNIINDPFMLFLICALIVFVGFGAGAYPSLYLSSFRPAEILKGKKEENSNSGLLRASMVTMQFAIAIGLILMTAVMYFQVDLAQNKVLGFEKDDKYMLFSNLEEDSEAALDTIRSEFMKMPQITDITVADRNLPLSGDNAGRIQLLGRETSDVYFIDRLTGDYNFLSFYNAELLAGRLFSPNFQSDLVTPIDNEENGYKRGVIINQNALEYMGFDSAEDAIGNTMVVTEINSDDRTLSTIVGVVKDTNFASLHSPIRPMIFQLGIENLWAVSLQYDRAYRANLAESLHEKWAEISQSNNKPSGFYLDDQYNFHYQADEERMMTFAFFSSFAIFVACLGLYGLACFEAEQRTKEIGIRKVMGAKVKDIVKMMIWRFSKPVLLANIIAWPIGWYFMNDWLTTFEYRIELSGHFYLFAVAGMITLIIAWLTVGIHAFRVARANPIKALRYE